MNGKLLKPHISTMTRDTSIRHDIQEPDQQTTIKWLLSSFTINLYKESDQIKTSSSVLVLSSSITNNLITNLPSTTVMTHHGTALVSSGLTLVTDDFHEDSSYQYQKPGSAHNAGGGGGGQDLTRGPLLNDLVQHQGGHQGGHLGGHQANFNQIR